MGETVTVHPIFGIILLLQLVSCSLGWGGNKVLLEDVKALTLKRGSWTTGRRSSPVPQLKCVGGTANCEFTPRVVQCYNRGSDGSSVQWECKAEMDNGYQFGDLSVTCEGYDYPDDPYVLEGSCGVREFETLEYNIDLSHWWNPNLHPTTSKKNNLMMYSLFGVVAVVIGCVLYKTCIAPTEETRQGSSTDDDDHGQGQGPTGSTHTAGGIRRSASANGYLTGMGTGGFLGYTIANRNTRSYTGGYSSGRMGGTGGCFSSSGFGGTTRR